MCSAGGFSAKVRKRNRFVFGLTRDSRFLFALVFQQFCGGWMGGFTFFDFKPIRSTHFLLAIARLGTEFYKSNDPDLMSVCVCTSNVKAQYFAIFPYVFYRNSLCSIRHQFRIK